MKVYIGDKKDVERYVITKVTDFVKPLLNRNRLPENELLRKYGKCYAEYDLVFNIEESDFCILPFSWNYYYENKKILEAESFINSCKRQGKEVVTLTLGDFGVTPTIKDVIILRQSGYQSERLLKQFAIPVIFSDPLVGFYNNNLQIREKGDLPVVGFCGQGELSKLNYAAMTAITLYRNSMYYIGMNDNEPQVLYPSTLRRNRVLKTLSESPKVSADFIIRKKYRGGARTEEDMLRTTMEFYNNIRNTDYTVAIRGGGNFSVRIYETLAIGRIPLYINTDSVLPFDKQINWKNHLVWVEEGDIKYIDEILSDFHNSIHPDDFKQMQIDNRKLWVDYLSYGGNYCYLKNIVKSAQNI